MRAALVGATYRKLLLLSPAARLRASSGEITRDHTRSPKITRDHPRSHEIGRDHTTSAETEGWRIRLGRRDHQPDGLGRATHRRPHAVPARALVCAAAGDRRDGARAAYNSSCERRIFTPPGCARQVTAALAILGRELGWAVLPGLAVIGAMLRLNKSIAAATCRLPAEAAVATTGRFFMALSGVSRYRLQKQLQLARDERARLTRELLGGIKAV